MPSTVVRLVCPNLKCRRILSAPIGARGKTVRCRSCGMRVRVPLPKTDAPAEPASVGDVDAPTDEIDTNSDAPAE